MKTKIKLLALIAGLMSVLPLSSAWAGGGGSSTTYYAALKAAVSNTGGGKVYAGTSKTEGDYVATSTSTQSSTTQNEGKTFYAFAQADSGYEFAGWATSDGGTVASTDNPYAVTVKCSSETEGSPTTTTVWANFTKKTLAAFDITFETSDAGTYTVDGVTPGNKTGLIEATTVKLASADPNFLNWNINGAVVSDNPYDLTCIAETTVSAEFLTADMVAEVANYDELTEALANAGKKKIIIPSGKDITVAKGATLTVSAGKQLVVNGILMVIGSIVNNGTILGSGIIAYNAKTITQEAKVNVPFPAGTDGPAGTASGLVACDENNKANEVSSAGKYLNTSVADGVKALTGLSLTTRYFVTVVNKASGETFTSSLLDSAPKAVVCTVARDKALNWISGMDGTASSYSSVKSALDRAKTSSVSGVANYSDSHNRMVVLTENAGTVEYDGGGSSVTFGTIVDLAGKSLTVSASNKTQYNYHAIVRAFNGSISLSQKVMSTKFYLYNCTGSLGYLSGGNQYGTAAYLYDSPKFSVTFKDVVGTSPAGSLNFCGGGPYSTTYVKFQTTPTTKFNVAYAGTFVSGMNPTSYLYDPNKVEAVQDPSTKNWIVQDKYVDPNKGQTLVNGEEHSFVEAFEIAKAGDVIKLQREVELEEDLEVASGKAVRLDLAGYALSGDFKIVNNGELEIIDCNNGTSPSQVNVPIVNNGTLLLSKAAYNGAVTLNKGMCYFLAGSFNADVIVAADAVASEIAQVRGGTFAMSVYKQGDGEGTLLSLCENGYTANGKIAQIPDSYITGPGTAKKASFSVKALSPYLEGLVNRVTSYEENRAQYTKPEWIDLMTVRASSSLFANWNVDCGVRVDRNVNEGDLTLSITLATEKIPAISAGDSASVLLPAMRDSGYATSPWGYQSILPGGENESKLSFSVQGESAAEGTSVWMEMRLVSSVHVSTQPKDWSYSGPYVVTGTRRFVVGAETNKAMVWGDTSGATFYSTLTTAVASDATTEKTIKLCNDCGDDVTVGKACTIDTNGFAFTGTITAAEGYKISNDGNGKYVVSKKIEVVVDTGDSPESDAQFKVEVTTKKLEDLGVDMTGSADEIQAQAAEKLEERQESGLKNWETIVVEEEKAKPNATPVLAKVVETVEVKDEAEQKVLKTGEKVSDSIDNVDFAALDAGTYRQAFVSTDAHENKVTIADPEAPTIAVVKNTSTDKTIILPVPGTNTGAAATVAIDTIIDPSSLSKDDVVTFYTGTVKQEWKFNGMEDNKQQWTATTTASPTGLNTLSSGLELPAGAAFWLTRAEPSKPVVIVTEAAKTIEPTVTKGEWNLEANPDPVKEVEIKDVVKNPNEGDQVIIPTASGAQQKVTLDAQGGWTYKRTYVENGQIKTERVSAKVKGGQGFWYVSKDKDAAKETTIKWK